MKTIVLVAIGALLAAVGFEYGDSWPYQLGQVIGWCGVALSILAAYLQYMANKPFELIFQETTWAPDKSEFRITIPQYQHKKHAGIAASVYGKTAAGYEEVGCDCHVTDANAVDIRANLRFSGKIVIK